MYAIFHTYNSNMKFVQVYILEILCFRSRCHKHGHTHAHVIVAHESIFFVNINPLPYFVLISAWIERLRNVNLSSEKVIATFPAHVRMNNMDVLQMSSRVPKTNQQGEQMGMAGVLIALVLVLVIMCLIIVLLVYQIMKRQTLIRFKRNSKTQTKKSDDKASSAKYKDDNIYEVSSLDVGDVTKKHRDDSFAYDDVRREDDVRDEGGRQTCSTSVYTIVQKSDLNRMV